MSFTLTQAAKEAGISKSTLSVAIQKGRLSAVHRPDGSYEIEPVELFRVYPPKAGTTEVRERVRPATELKPNPTEPRAESQVFEEQLAVMRGRLEASEARTRALEDQLARERELADRAQDRAQDTVADLRKRLDRAEERVLALSAQPVPPAPQPVPEPAQEPPAVVEELRRRLEELEARNQALAAAVVPQRVEEPRPEGPAEVPPAGPVRSLLSRLLGR